MKFWSSGDSRGSIVENKLKTFVLRSRKIEQGRVAVVKSGVNKRISSSRSSSATNLVGNTS